MPRCLQVLPAFVVSAAALHTAAQIHVYVDDDAPPGGDGLSWTSALHDLREAVALSESLGPDRGEIRIAGGSYLGDGQGPLIVPIPNEGGSKRIYLAGGYAGLDQPGAPDTRDIDSFQTHLLGDDAVPIIEIQNFEANPSITLTPLSAFDLGRATSFEGLRFADNQAISVEALPETPILIDRCFFIGCTTDGNGGAIYANGASVFIRESYFEACSAPNGDGGAVFHSGNVLGLKSSEFAGNAAVNGGAVATENARDFGFTDSLFANNMATGTSEATGRGGAVFDQSRGFPVHIGSEFIDNHGRAGGGMWTSAISIFDSTMFTNNHADDAGGGLYITESFGGHLNIYRGCVFDGNSAHTGGAVVLVYDGRNFHQWINTSFIRNVASDYGGGVVIEGKEQRENAISFRDGLFQLNLSSDGGALSSSHPVAIVSSIFDNNTGSEGGGAFLPAGGVIESSVFSFNRSGTGGAVFGPVDIRSSEFLLNAAIDSGGAVWGATVITGSTFVSNGASGSGGAAAQVGMVEQSSFTSNSANSRGGAIDGIESGADLIFVNNLALRGGAVSRIGLQLIDSDFIENRTTTGTSFGSAIFHDIDGVALVARIRAVGASNSPIPVVEAIRGTIQLEDSLILGGIRSQIAGFIDVIRCTLDRRSPTQGQLVIAGSLGAIAIESTVVGDANAVIVLDGGELLITQSLVVGGQASISGPGSNSVILLGDILDADPRFADPSGPDGMIESWEDNDYRPASGSPLIDAGFGFMVDSSALSDLAGNPRVADDPSIPNTGIGIDPVDIGAYEFQGISCLPDITGDGVLAPDDFSAWVSAYNARSPRADQNGDGQISPSDFFAWVANYNAGCP